MRNNCVLYDNMQNASRTAELNYFIIEFSVCLEYLAQWIQLVQILRWDSAFFGI